MLVNELTFSFQVDSFINKGFKRNATCIRKDFVPINELVH